MAKDRLNEQLESEIRSVKGEYTAQSIQVLEGLEPVRKRPGMYIGSTDKRGLHHLITEVVDNSVDEALAGYCKNIEVVLNDDGSCSIVDDGRGIPTGIIDKEKKSAVEVVLTKLHAGGKFGGNGYKVSGGLHGVGVSVVNALSEWLDVEIRQKGKIHTQTYNRGIPQRALAIKGDIPKGEKRTTGTKITFMPDDEIFETLDFDYEFLRTKFREVAFLNKGLSISIEDARNGANKKETFQFKNGIVEFVEYRCKNANKLFPEIIYVQKINKENGKTGASEVEIAMQYTDGYNEVINAYANNINTEEGGTHLDGFKAALTKVVNDYALKNKIIKESEKLSGEDVREGIIAIISVKLTDPQFEGQTKTKLGNSEMRTIVSKIVEEELGDYFEEHPKEAKEFVLKCIAAQRARDAARNAQNLARRKNVLESTTLPGKLADCSEKDPRRCEIYIVEGDSAGGTAKQGRDRRFQAILPLRGKILNVEKARLDRVLENEEIKAMITAFGAGIKEKFDETKLRYDKIICMTDADVDGSHIRILLLTFFYRFMRPLVENGHVYIAMPPLYKISFGKNVEYAYSDYEREEKTKGKKGYDIQRYKGLGEMSHEQLWETTMNPENRTLGRVTMEDVEEANKTFEMLMGEDPAVRREFIENNAKLVKELDV